MLLTIPPPPGAERGPSAHSVAGVLRSAPSFRSQRSLRSLRQHVPGQREKRGGRASPRKPGTSYTTCTPGDPHAASSHPHKHSEVSPGGYLKNGRLSLLPARTTAQGSWRSRSTLVPQPHRPTSLGLCPPPCPPGLPGSQGGKLHASVPAPSRI